MAGRAAYRHHRRSSSFIGSCFTGSPIYEDEDGPTLSLLTPTTTKPPPSKFLRFFSMPAGKKKKEETVPFDADAPETPTDYRNDNNYKSTTKSHQHRRRFSAATASSCLEEYPKKPCIIHISSKSDSHIQKSPLHQLRDSAHTATATIHTGKRKNRLCDQSESNAFIQKTPKKCDAKGKLDPDAGILIVMVILATLVLFGRASAIVCMSVWFYLAPRRRATALSRMSSSKKSLLGSKNECSGEEKRRVVLQGLLERKGRKLSRSVTAPSGTS